MSELGESRAYEFRDMDPAYEDDALARGRQKLAALRTEAGRGQPVGRLVGRVVAAGIFLGLPGLAAFVFAARLAMEPRPEWAGVVLLGVFGALFFLATWLVYTGAKADSPRRALRLFYRSLGAGRAKRALRYVVPVDQDAFPRFQPDIPGLGAPTDLPFRFDQPDSFAAYWDTLLRYHTAPYCLASIKKVRVHMIGDDLAVVRFRLTLLMNTRLWLILVVVALLIALIIDVATRKTASQEMQRILVRVGDEWHLYDGAWLGVDEEDTSWLHA